MRKVSLLIGICLLVALALTLAAQAPTDLSPIMKDVQATQTKMRMDMMSGNGADVAADAAKLQQDFTQAQGFFKAMKAQDAVDMAKANVDAAGEVVKAAKANKMDDAKAPAGTIQKSCKACHDVHREQLPDKTYKFK
jgi:Spy/CpxP family protein refolding chaperone